MESGEGKKTGLVVGLSVCAFVVVGGLGLVWFYTWKKRHTGGDQEDGGDSDLAMDEDFEKGTGPRKFSFNELALATTNFSEGEKLGEGGFGGVYRGLLGELNSYVAVKRVTRNSQQGMKEYASEVKIFCRLRHWNLVQLVEASRPCDPCSCQMDARSQPRLSYGSVVPAKDVRTGCPDTPSDGFVSHG